MPALGIDFGTSFIKLALVEGDSLKKTVILVNPLAKVELEPAREVPMMVEVIKKGLVENKIQDKQVNIVIPESAAYTSVINLPVLSDTELASSLKWEAEQYVPLPLAEVELSWEVLDRPARKTGSEKMRVLLVAANKRLIQSLIDVFSVQGVEPVNIETELLATSRSVLTDKDTYPLVIVSIGASAMGMAVYRAGKLVFVSKFASGGLSLTRAISQSLSLSLQQAEEYKRTYGIKVGVLENRLINAMAPVTNGWVEEIRRVQSYYQQQFANEKLQRLMLTGGGALLPGLLPFLSERTGLEVVIGDPLKNVKPGAGVTAGPIMAAGIGAAVRK